MIIKDLPPIAPAIAKSEMPLEKDKGARRETMSNTYLGVLSTNLFYIKIIK